eukprot:CAMPEP_0168727536 /NCGR_PEP_ID=MMETSP0724-20121128/5227_1 /TAXON_ID=265536 /ORGANISM="Amphiprora sp., Strain CCMP467" /LENGTH=185 /DNA_ID=CAMNT_0008774369 /DNA_START=53 /DNA_END=610 /DNA_ORIENTATION=-
MTGPRNRSSMDTPEKMMTLEGERTDEVLGVRCPVPNNREDHGNNDNKNNAASDVVRGYVWAKLKSRIQRRIEERANEAGSGGIRTMVVVAANKKDDGELLFWAKVKSRIQRRIQERAREAGSGGLRAAQSEDRNADDPLEPCVTLFPTAAAPSKQRHNQKHRRVLNPSRKDNCGPNKKRRRIQAS